MLFCCVVLSRVVLCYVVSLEDNCVVVCVVVLCRVVLCCGLSSCVVLWFVVFLFCCVALCR